MAHAPHAALKAQKCPREGCTGRVQDTDRVVQTKRKKIIEASLAAPAAIPVPAPKPTGKGKKTHKAPAASQVEPMCWWKEELPCASHDPLSLLLSLPAPHHILGKVAAKPCCLRMCVCNSFCNLGNISLTHRFQDVYVNGLVARSQPLPTPISTVTIGDYAGHSSNHQHHHLHSIALQQS